MIMAQRRIENFISEMRPELGLVISNDVKGVIEYFRKVTVHIREDEVIRFENYNRYFPRSEHVRWSVATNVFKDTQAFHYIAKQPRFL